MIRRRIILGLSVMLLFSPTLALAQTTVEVQMTNGLTFDPSVVTITVGDTVRWINVSNRLRHTATADKLRDQLAGFNSGSFPTKSMPRGTCGSPTWPATASASSSRPSVLFSCSASQRL